MEIKTRVLTNPQHLEPSRRETARKNIAAIGKIKVSPNTRLAPPEGSDELDLSAHSVPTPDASGKILKSSADGKYSWETPYGIEQVPADWDQVDRTKPDYIKNKPGLYQGATDEHPGASGFVPAALSDERDLYLKGDGTWGKPDSIPGDGKLYIALGNSHPTDTGFSANSDNNVIIDIPEAASATAQEAAHGGLMTTDDKTKLDDIDLGITPGTGADSDKVNIQLKNNVSTNVLTAHQDVSGKADKSEMAISPVSGDATKKNIQLKDGLSQEVVVAHQNISGKADKVTGATSGNFAGLDANGNLVDSGKKASDFASASAVQSVKMKDSSGNELNNGTNVIIPEASTTSPGVMSVDDKSKLNGIAPEANKYIHPSYTAQNSGMYKMTIDAQGHVSSVAAIEKSDITALGIPAQDTTYNFADDYDGTTNKGATEATVRNAVSNAINALDATVTSPDTLDAHFVIRLVEENGLLTGITVLTDKTVTATQVNTAIAEALANYGGFQVVPLTTGDNPHPDIQNPSEKYIYLTKDTQSSARDPYTEWIYIKGDASADPPTENHWEVIGETSVNLSNYIQKVSGATENNFAAFTADGAIKDSGKNENSFATAAQGTKADSAVQSVKIGSSSGTELKDGTNVVIPEATQNTPGVMSASDKSKLDSINNYIESATVSGRTMTLTPKSGPAVTFNDTGDINVIEKISVNGTQQTVTNKEVDLTIPAAANNAKITLKVDGAAAGATTPVAGDFTVDQSLDKDIAIPAAVSASGNDPAKPGVMSSADKAKLDGIANGAEVNSIERITIEGDQNPLPISSENVTIPKAAYTTGVDPSYTSGAVTGQDKKKLDEIEAGAQVNDIEHIKIAGESADLTIDANKRIELPLAASATTSPVAPATPGIMSAPDKDKLDHIAPNAEENTIETISIDGGETLPIDEYKNVNIPLASPSAPAHDELSAVAGNPGAMSANDKAKLNSIEQGAQVNVKPDWNAESGDPNEILNKPSMVGKVHFLKAVNDYLADVSAPYGSWIVDLEKPNAESPYGYDYAMASEIMAKLSAGEIFVLSTYSTAPSSNEDLFTMGVAQDQSREGHTAVRIDFTRMYAGSPEYMYYTAIYTPSMYNGSSDTVVPEERMAIFNPRGQQAPLCSFEFMPYTNLADVATTGNYNDLSNKPNLTLKEDVSNKSQTIDTSSTTDYPSSKAVADFIDSSIAGIKTTTVRQNGQADNAKCPTEAAVRTAIDSAVSSAYHAAGTKTVAHLTSSLLISAYEGDVYNLTDSGVTTSDFIEGAGYPIRAGDNVVVCNVGGGVYKFDLLSGFIDLTNYLTKTGDGSDVTASFNTASARTNVTTGDKLSVLFGKVSKWFSDLKSLAFKDKVDTADIENDAVTADKVKDNETLPVNISGYASHLRQARCRFSNNQTGYRLMAYLPPESGYSDTLYVFNIYEARDAAVLDSGVLKGTLSVCIRNNDGSFQYSSSYSGYSLSDIGIHLRVDTSTHGINLYAAKSNSYYSTAIFELLNAYEQNGTEMNPTMYVNSTLLESITGTTITPTVTLLKQSAGTIPLANNSGVGSTTQPVYVDSSGLVQPCNSVIAKNLESSLSSYGTSGSKFRLVAKSAPLGNTVNVHFECRISASNYSLFQSATLLFNAVYSQSDNSITFSNAGVVNDYGSSNLWRFYLVPNVVEHTVEIYAEAIGSSYNSLNLIALFANGEGQNYVNGTTYLHTVVDSVPTPNVVVPVRKVVSIDSAVGSATEPVYVSSTGEVLQCTPSSMSVGTASYAILADTGVKLPTAWGAFDVQTGYRLLATLTAPGDWNDRICTFNVFETRAGMSEPYGQLGTLTVQIRNNNGPVAYGASYCGIPLQNIDIVVRSNSDQSMSIYAYSSGSVYGGLQLALASSSGYTGNPTGREGLTLYLNNSIQATVTGNAVTIYKTRLWDYAKNQISSNTANVNQVDNNTETNSFTFVNGHVYHLTLTLEGSPLLITSASSGTGYVVAYIGSSMSQSHFTCKQSVDIQSGELTMKDIKLPVNWKAENITGSSDNQIHVVVVLNHTYYGFSTTSPYQLVLQGTDFSGA